MFDNIKNNNLKKKIIIILSYLVIYYIVSEILYILAGYKSGPIAVATLFFPPTAITMAFLIYFDIWIIPFIPIDIFLNAYLRGRPFYVYFFEPLIITVVYGFIGYVLKRVVKINSKLQSLRDGIAFITLTAIGSFIVATMYSFIRYVYDPNASLSPYQFAFDFFLGDIVAIYALTPLCIVIIFPFIEKLINGEVDKVRLNKYFQFVSITLVVSLIFTVLIFYQNIFVSTQLLALFFIPLAIISLVYGIKGAIIINNFIILEVILVLNFVQDIEFFQFQMTIFSLSSVAIIIGVVISERQNYLNSIEDIIKKRTRELEIANEDLNYFNYSVSHDLKTPLHNANQIIDIILNDNEINSNPVISNRLKSLEVNNKKMEELLSDLLDFFKLNQQNLVKTKVNMIQIVNEAYDLIKTNIDKERTELRISDELPECYCDPSLILIVWSNLLSNSIKYSSKLEKSIIEIGYTKTKNKSGYFFIHDNGIGFDMKDNSKLFVLFQRLHPEYEGTGLGLSVVKRIITKHGGSIWAESEPDKGATFYFTI